MTGCPDCPNCKSKLTAKVISAALPMKFCQNCHSLWGEPWATVYTFILAPVAGMLCGGFSFFPYEGSYFKGILDWIADYWDDSN